VKKTTTKHPKPIRHIATRNGVPCSLTFTQLRSRIRFSGRVLFPLPLPPCDPYVFASQASAEKAVARTEHISRKLRTSIHVDFIQKNFPDLSPLCVTANYKIEPFKKAGAA